MTNIRWSQEQLNNHLKAHQMRKNEGKERFKKKNDAKVCKANKTLNTSNGEEIRTGEIEEILDCEIAAVPPSVNHYWVATGKKRYLSDKALTFHAVIQMMVPPLKTAKRLKLDVTFHFPDRLRRDIDNYLKATIDSLVKCGFCVDDEQFDELIVKRGNVVSGGLIKIKVWEI